MVIFSRYLQYYKLIITYLYFRYEVKVLDELETKVEPAVHELRLGWSTDDTDMQLGKFFYIVMSTAKNLGFEFSATSIIIITFIVT